MISAERLALHNRRWGHALRNWYDHAEVAWTPGMIVDHELRVRFDTFFPWREFSASLRGLARELLPSEEWTPRLLAENAVETALDFWEEVPEFCGQAVFTPEELLPFFCTCADPPRFGTRLGRYPEQLDILPQAKSLLDLGCGVGIGTLEAARKTGASRVLGVTLEPLEAWMATQRHLPHDPQRTREFQEFSDISAEFLAGDAAAFRPANGERFELVICNGLAGGRFMNTPAQLEGFLDTLEVCTAPGGLVALANSFHPGHQKGVEELARRASARGWTVSGNWRQMTFL